MEVASVRAVLFAKNLDQLTTFYAKVLDLVGGRVDEHHAVLRKDSFELILHQIPPEYATEIVIQAPPVRRESVPVRLDFPVESIETSRNIAASLGGGIDPDPPGSVSPDTNFYLGFDPEGNVLGVSERRR